MDIKNKFNNWNEIKYKIENKKQIIKFSQGNIYFMSVGQNIGSETYGKKDLFLRPVLVYRKLSSTSFVGIPLTSKQKEGNYYFTFRYTKKTLSTALLNQIRVFDIKRASYYDGYIRTKDFTKLRDQVKKFVDITPNPKRKGNGHVPKELPKCDKIIPQKINFVNKDTKKILVTGGAGFVGSHLCERLLSMGYEVVSLDNYFTGSVDNHIDGVHYIKGDTKDISTLITFTPDMVYHLGEYSRVEQSFDDIQKVWEFNKDGIFAVLEFVRKAGCKILYAGSSTKFGDGGLGRSASPYAWTKATNTELVMNYGAWFNVPYAITYFYNVYGDREISAGKYATLIALFKEKMKNDEPLTIVSPGTQKRNFTHIDDIVNGLVLVGENGYGDEFGIGSPEAFTIKEVAQMFGGEIQMLSERKGNRMVADVISAKTESLGWKPTKKLEDYIKEYKETGF